MPASAGLDEVLGRMLHSTAPLAVTDENDEFVGVLSRRKVVELIRPTLPAEAGVSGDAVEAAGETGGSAPEDERDRPAGAQRSAA